MRWLLVCFMLSFLSSHQLNGQQHELNRALQANLRIMKALGIQQRPNYMVSEASPHLQVDDAHPGTRFASFDHGGFDTNGQYLKPVIYVSDAMFDFLKDERLYFQKLRSLYGAFERSIFAG